jgi:hypothetical protein
MFQLLFHCKKSQKWICILLMLFIWSTRGDILTKESLPQVEQDNTKKLVEKGLVENNQQNNKIELVIILTIHSKHLTILGFIRN